MEVLIKILDVFTAMLVVTSLWLTSKYLFAWLIYSMSAILCIIIYWYKGLPGMALMAIFLAIVGLKNYYVGRKKE